MVIDHKKKYFLLFYSSINTLNMYGYNNYNAYANQELQSDMWIQRNIPGGLNSKSSENYF